MVVALFVLGAVAFGAANRYCVEGDEDDHEDDDGSKGEAVPYDDERAVGVPLVVTRVGVVQLVLVGIEPHLLRRRRACQIVG